MASLSKLKEVSLSTKVKLSSAKVSKVRPVISEKEKQIKYNDESDSYPEMFPSPISLDKRVRFNPKV